MKKLLLLVTSLSLLLSTSCSKDDITPDVEIPDQEQTTPDSPDEPDAPDDPDYKVDYSEFHEASSDYDITYQYKEGVIVLNEVAQKYLIKVEADTILYFSNSTPANILPEVGTVISSPVCDKTPYGLGNKVVEISETNGTVKCVTTTTSLNEIFEKLELTATLQMASMATDEYQARSRAEIGKMDLIKIPVKTTDGNGFFAEMNLEIGGIFTFNIDLGAKTYEVSLTSGIALRGEMGVKYEVNDENDNNQLKTLLQLLPETNIFTGFIPIAGGVIVLRPYADFGMALKGALEGKISFDINKSYIFKSGWNQDGFFTEDLSEDDTNLFNNLNIEGKFKVGPVADIDFGLGLWTKNLGAQLTIEPRILLGGELGLAYDDEGKCAIGNQELTMTADIDVNGKLFVKFFDWEQSIPAKFVNIPLFAYSIPIFPGAPQLRTTVYSENPVNVKLDFIMDDNALIKFLPGTPTVFVMDNGELLEKIDGKGYSGRVEGSSGSYAYYGFTFEIGGLEQNTEYTLVPGLMLGGIFYYWKDYTFVQRDTTAPSLSFDNVQITKAYHAENTDLYIYEANINFELGNVEGLFELRLQYNYTENGVSKTTSLIGIYNPDIATEYHNGANSITHTFNFYSPVINGTFVPSLRKLSSTIDEPVFTNYDFNFIFNGNYPQ